MPMTKREIENLLKKPNVAVVAVTAPDGAPHAVPTWYEYLNGEVVFHTGEESFKYKCLVRDPRIALVIDTRDAPYKCVILKGRAALTVGVVDDVRTRRMAVAYLGKRSGEAYAKSMKGSRVVIVRFKPARVISWDYGKESP
jgi:PPOX class probable F420-dependent enzyme